MLRLLFFLTLNSTVAAEKPNVLLILADDLGFSDLGCYGSEIKTPHLDSLAENGLRFTKFYNTARCWPTRAALMTGYYPQQVRRDFLPGQKHKSRGSREKRPTWATLLPEMLKPAGYRSYHIGKWHIDGMPCAAGYDRSYYLKDDGRYFNPKTHFLDDQPLPPVQKNTGYYATTSMADHTIRFLDEHQKKHPGKPFFTYLALIAPHFPLHAPAEDIAKYQNTYSQGWKKTRKQRSLKLQELGFPKMTLSVVERELGPPYHFPKALETLGSDEVNRPLPWESLTPSQKKFQSTKMAIHAAMVDRIDQEVGRIMTHLKSQKQFKNTLILFLSDNGASAEIMVRHDGHDPDAPMGSAPSYLCLGPGWSTTANTPFRKHKIWTHEGGISTPLIAHWPSGIPHQAGKFRHTPAHVIDIVPTILSLAKSTNPSKGPKFPGKSLLPVFSKDSSDHHEHLWWCHAGHRAIQKGGWKAVATKKGPWELYNLTSDRTETNNLAHQHPETLKTLSLLWKKLADQMAKDSAH